MSDTEGPAAGVLARLAAARGTGSAADGLVTVEVDGTSNIVDLVIEPRAMRLPSADLADAVKAAFATARGAVQEQLSTGDPAAAPETDTVRATLDELQFDAQRRLSELTAIAQDLSSRLDRMT
jgi:DNA-binding protein YbaB